MSGRRTNEYVVGCRAELELVLSQSFFFGEVTVWWQPGESRPQAYHRVDQDHTPQEHYIGIYCCRIYHFLTLPLSYGHPLTLQLTEVELSSPSS